MRFHWLRLQNFKGFVDETINLDRPLTVLVGSNGAGKSTIIDALSVLMSDVISNQHPDLTFSDQEFLSWSAEAIDVRRSTLKASIEAEISAGETAKLLVHSISLDPDTGELRDMKGARIPNAGLQVFFSKAGEQPLFFRYTPVRRIDREWRKPKNGESDSPNRNGEWLSAVADVFAADLGFSLFFRWFRDREDIENEKLRKDRTYEDPQLRCVRAAVSSMLHGFADLHVQREPLHMVVSKNDQQLYVDQLSDGEKSILVMSADIARRLSIAHAKLSEPLNGEAVVAIDEIDLHLHPAWQRVVVGRLRSTFPNCQFIVTTHSPQVLSEVPTDSVVMLREFKVEQLSAPVSGRDTNSILTEVLGVSERPETESEDESAQECSAGVSGCNQREVVEQEPNEIDA